MEYSDEEMEDFSRFATLPNELLIATCENMDNQTLTRFANVYKRASLVCSDVLKERKKKVVPGRMEALILSSNNTTFKKRYNNRDVIISINKPSINTFVIKQHISTAITDDIEWIFPELEYTVTTSPFGFIIRSSNRIGKDLIPYVVEQLFEHGYRSFT